MADVILKIGKELPLFLKKGSHLKEMI